MTLHFNQEPCICLYSHRLVCSSKGKESACDAGDQGSIPGLGRSRVGSPALQVDSLPAELPTIQTNHVTKIHMIGASGWVRGLNEIKASSPFSCHLTLGRSPGEGNGNPLQYSFLGNPMDRGAWQATVHGITRVGYDFGTKRPTFGR